MPGGRGVDVECGRQHQSEHSLTDRVLGATATMPTFYRIDVRNRVVIHELAGVVTDQELSNNQRELRRDPDYDPVFGQLIDACYVTDIAVSSDLVVALAKATPNVPGAKRAIVVASDVAFGMARMFQIIREDAPEEVRVFRDIDEARRWLGLA